MLALASLAFASSAEAQSLARIPRVGFLGVDSKTLAPHKAAFVARMVALGYEDGRNVVIDYRWADSRFDRLPALALELAALGPDAIVALAPPAVRAAQKATSTIPVVAMVRDPVQMGLAASLARPGGNTTGVAFPDAELSAKRMDILRQVVPRLSRAGVIWNKEGAGIDAVRALEEAAKRAGIEVLSLEVKEPADIPRLVASAKSWKAEGIVQLPSQLLYQHRAILVEAVARDRLPLLCEERTFVVDGCLMTYSASYTALAAHLADYVDRILRGAKAGELPFELPREFDFVINQRTAQALGLAVPTALLVQATEVIRE
jgi:putative ABC transport system substrate-binding protein